ncbi:TPA: glycosyl transferase [Candidatus Falkowbacteria bacterium]|nr:MAG: Glycosyl transferase [Candidatus Falkowbacteria bacterium GW2011_GWF2_43_32]HBA36499.1 glycosyl transferase [Candidatus Falkowbacteria bacterium]
MFPLVSVVITTKNEEKNIENCLRSIKEQGYNNIEVIVVDNNSDDQTKEIAERYTDKVYDKGPERSAQRNYGMIDKSAGEYVMFVDADMILSPGLISNCVEFISQEKAVALHISEIVLGRNFWSRVRRFERSFYDGTAIDGARFFSKDKFVEVGGFDETMSGPEDWDIDKKIKQIGKIGLLPVGRENNTKDWPLINLIKDKGVNPHNYQSVVYHNESEFNLKKYLKKKNYYSRSFAIYINKWGKDDPDIKKQFGLKYRFFGVFLEAGKWRKLLGHPILTLGMYFLRGMVGVEFLLK